MFDFLLLQNLQTLGKIYFSHKLLNPFFRSIFSSFQNSMWCANMMLITLKSFWINPRPCFFRLFEIISIFLLQRLWLALVLRPKNLIGRSTMLIGKFLRVHCANPWILHCKFPDSQESSCLQSFQSGISRQSWSLWTAQKVSRQCGAFLNFQNRKFPDRCQLKTCSGCYCCWCWWFVADLEAEVWS